MNLYLKPFSPLDGRAEWDFLQRIGQGENGFSNDGYDVPFEEFNQYINKHIGYCIEPDHRSKGYGRKILERLLEKARLKGIDAVLITCERQIPLRSG